MRGINLIVIMIAVLSLIGCDSVYTSPPLATGHHSSHIIIASALSKGGQYNLISDNNSVCLWKNNQEKHPLYCLRDEQAQLINLVDISENNLFYLISNRVSVCLYSLKNHQQLGEWQFAGNIINDMDISADGSKVLLGFRSGKSSIIDIKHNRIHTFTKHRLDINSVSLSDDGEIAFTGSSDKKAFVWNTTTGRNIQEFTHGSRVNHVNMSADGKIGFTLDAINDRIFWDLSTGQELSELTTHLRFFEFNDSVFSNDNSLLLTGSPKQVIKLWKVSNGDLIAQWKSKKEKGRASVLSVAYAPEQKVVTINSDGLYEQWQLPKLQTQ